MRHTLVAGTTLLLALGLSGCLISPDASNETSEEPVTNDYTVEQARQDPIDLVTDTTELLASDNWESSSGTPWPGSCTMPNGEEGASYGYTLYSKPPSSDVDDEAQTVAESWESLGMNVRIVDHDGYPTVQATGGPVVQASFLTNVPETDKYRVSAVGSCAPGDSQELKLVENERAEQREVIPGDNYFHNHPAEGTGQE